MNRVIRILMKRDGLSEEDATAMVEDCRSELLDAVYGTSCMDPTEIIEMELGLEPDYLDDLLF